MTEQMKLALMVPLLLTVVLIAGVLAYGYVADDSRAWLVKRGVVCPDGNAKVRADDREGMFGEPAYECRPTN